jgi:hypothetical protein
LTNGARWRVGQGVVENNNRVLVGLSFAFPAVCLINTVGRLLAKSLNGASIAGVRRDVGASRRQIFLQHIIEVGMLSSLGRVTPAAAIQGPQVRCRSQHGDLLIAVTGLLLAICSLGNQNCVIDSLAAGGLPAI